MNNYMEIALKEAEKAYKKDEVPVGAIIIKDNKIIAKAHNLKEHKKCAIKHAEIIAIEKASKRLKTWHLDNCIMYVTLEPCKMCSGAIEEARIKQIYYATKSDYMNNVSRETLGNKKCNVSRETYKELYNEKAVNLLQNFFKSKRK